MFLHITPKDLEKMYWYDISMLLKRYEKYVEEQNEENEKMKAEQEQEYEPPEIPDYKNFQNEISNNIGKFDMSNLTKGFNIPKF